MISALTDALNQIEDYNLEDIVDSLKGIAENLVEQSKRFETSQKLLNQKVLMLDSLNSTNITIDEYGKTIRLYQKEIESQSKRFFEICSVISMSRKHLSKIPNVVPLINDIEKLLEFNPAQNETINSLKRAIDDLKIDDSAIESLEKQINQLKLERDQRIRAIKDASQVKMEEEKATKMRSIADSIKDTEEKKRQIEAILMKVQSEISSIEDEKRQLEEHEQLDHTQFIQESCVLETELIEVRRRVDELKATDLTGRLSSLKFEQEQLETTVSEMKTKLESLNEKLETIEKSNDNVGLEREVAQLEERLQELEEVTASLPSLEEWQSAQRELKVHIEVDELHCSEMSNEVARLKIECKNTESEVKRLTESIAQLNAVAEKAESEGKRLDLQLEQLKSGDAESAITDVLKDQRQRLGEINAEKESQIQNLRREQVALEGRIQSLKDEKESLVDLASSKGSDSVEMKRAKLREMSAPERAIVGIVSNILASPCSKVTILGYLVLLHVLVLFVCFS